MGLLTYFVSESRIENARKENGTQEGLIMRFNMQILILLVTFVLLNVTSVFSKEGTPEELMKTNGHISIGATAARGIPVLAD